MTEKAKNADFRRKPQSFADSPFSWRFKHLEGAGNRRKPQIFAENRRFLQKTAGNPFLENKAFGKRRLSQKNAGSGRRPQEPAETGGQAKHGFGEYGFEHRTQ